MTPEHSSERRSDDLADRRRKLRRASDLAAYSRKLSAQIDRLAKIGMALSGEKRIERIFEMIVDEARSMTDADAGTLYIVDEDSRQLVFMVLHNETMKTRMGGTSGKAVNLPPVAMYDELGKPNHTNVSSYVALTGNVVNIEDVYEAEGFDFTGTRKYDSTTGYRSQSMLVIPMRNHEDEIIGVVQLLNAKNRKTGEIIGFNAGLLSSVKSLASQAAVVLTNNQLIRDLKRLLYSFIRSIATAIDEKSPYTSGHINRVVKLTELIAEEINLQDHGPFEKLVFSEDEMEELKLAAWMHDVGKITTPEHIVDKSVRLETIHDRASLVSTRFDLIAEKLHSELLEKLLKFASNGSSPENMRSLAMEYEEKRLEIIEEKEFILACNNPEEFMNVDRISRVKKIATKTFQHNGHSEPYLSEDEVKNLTIPKGTLTEDERHIMENHAAVTTQLLSELTFPKRLSKVPDYAGHHHERLDGSGYPAGLTAEDLPLQARILAVADVFEALTAKDRPYKEPMKVSQALKILGFMNKDNHIDGNVYDLFVKSKIYREYAEQELDPSQMDDLDN